jgi:hypothetical protein
MNGPGYLLSYDSPNEYGAFPSGVSVSDKRQSERIRGRACDPEKRNEVCEDEGRNVRQGEKGGAVALSFLLSPALHLRRYCICRYLSDLKAK